MEDVNEGHHEDILRAFFKMEVIHVFLVVGGRC